MIFGMAFLSVLLMYTPASAGTTVQHVVGIVTAIDERHVEVKTPNKKAPISVKLSKQVRFKNKGNPASSEPPTVGDRVIIEATKESKILTATVVHYSAVKSAPVEPQ